MNAYLFVSNWVIAVYIYLGIIVYKAEPKNKLNRAYLFVNICLVVASIGNMFMYAAENRKEYIIWYNFGTVGWCVYTSLILHLSLILTKKRNLLGKKWMYLLIYMPIPAIILSEIFLMQYLKTNNSMLYYLLDGLEYIFYFVFPFMGIVGIWNWGKKSELRREKKQAKLICVSGIICAVLSLVNTVEVYALNMSNIPDMTNIIALILDLSIWYAIAKYGLINIKSLIKTEDVISKVTDLIFLIDENEKIAYINNKCEESLGYGFDELAGHHISKVISPWSSGIMSGEINSENDYSSFSCIAKNGREIPVCIKVSPLNNYSEGMIAGKVLVCKDMTLIRELRAEIEERKLKEEELNYLSFHDPVTGLYNRRFFEKQLDEIKAKGPASVGIIMCDIDGLKLINDAMGHSAGDELLAAFAGIITRTFENRGTVSRIGGDEFAVLVYDTDIAEIKKFKKMIYEYTEQSNNLRQGFKMSVSVGIAINEGTSRGIMDAVKEADDNMYREKLNHVSSARNSMIQGLMELLKARDYITEGHGERIKELVVKIGRSIGLPEDEITDLVLLAQFHDIGKVSIPDAILMKPGNLTGKEKLEMQRHSEIGYRISNSIPELRPISELILKHHERWDGTGHPLGLKEYDIPLKCRILSIVDAYDAMTHDRPYRKALSHDEAISELRKCAGSQFDPQLVEVLIKLLDSERDAA